MVVAVEAHQSTPQLLVLEVPEVAEMEPPTMVVRPLLRWQEPPIQVVVEEVVDTKF
jgi:hypothetical protein